MSGRLGFKRSNDDTFIEWITWDNLEQKRITNLLNILNTLFVL